MGNVDGCTSARSDYVRPENPDQQWTQLISTAEAARVEDRIIERCIHAQDKQRLLDEISKQRDLSIEEAEGEHSHGEMDQMPTFIAMLPPNPFKRIDSLDASNDPRNLNDTIITKRFNAFNSIIVGATLLASLALTVGDSYDDTTVPQSIPKMIGLFLLLMIFVMNMAAVSLLTLQYYQAMRLTTSGPHGFEVSKSFYHNQNVVKLRHLSVRMFVWSMPMFMVAVTCLMWDAYYVSSPLMVYISVATMATFTILNACALQKQISVFAYWEKRSKKLTEAAV